MRIGKTLPSLISFSESLNVLLDSAGSKASGVSKLFCKIESASRT